MVLRALFQSADGGWLEDVALLDGLFAEKLKVEAEKIAHLIADVLDAPEDAAVIERVRAQVAELCARFPVYGK